MKNDCILDFLFWDHLLEQNRSYQYIERGGKRNRDIQRKLQKRLHFGFSVLGPPAGAKQELPAYRERREEGGETEILRGNLKNG